jgi:hypothetical protein
MTHKKRKSEVISCLQMLNVLFCGGLRAEGLSCSLDVLHAVLGRNIKHLQFMISKIYYF